MIVAVSERFTDTVRWAALGVFFTLVFTIIATGSRWFAKQFDAARRPATE
jgi:hypothetical protein